MGVGTFLATVRRRLPGQYLWPVVTLVGLCFGCIVAVLFATTAAQDQLQRTRERQALEEALQTRVEMVVRDLQDYAKWDEAVRNIAWRLDREWVAANVVAYLGVTQGYTVFALDGQDRTILASHRGTNVDADATRLLGPDFRQAIAKLRRIPPGGRPILGGFARVDNALYIYSVAQIVPLTGKIRFGSGPTHLLAIVQRVDSALLAELSHDQHVRGLELRLAPGRTEGLVALSGVDGAPRAWLRWDGDRPGQALRHQTLPMFFVVALATLIAAALIVLRGGKAVEALQRSEAHARHQAFHDALSGLPNRRALVERIGLAFADKAPVSLLYMDLDGFKDANDLYGHAAGDILLREAARRITLAVPDAFVARAGGDEFAVLLLDIAQDTLEQAAQAILDAFARPFAVGSYWLSVGVSIGCVDRLAWSPSAEDDIMRYADTAMYAAKADGKQCWRIYEPRMDREHQLRVSMEHDLAMAIEDGALDVLYQPVVDAETGRTVSIEALARWTHPAHGVVPPDIFIPLAERSGLINALGQHVLRKACREALPLPVQLTVNLSPAQFWDRNLLTGIQSTLRDVRFPVERLELEITESYLLRRPDAAADILERLRGLGISIALDDFGTGFASIGYLRQLRFDRLKIDKEFIAPLAKGNQATELIGAIVALARSLGLQITAEGVETEVQARLARLAGCSQLQGWLYGHPMPIAQIAPLLAAKVRAPGVRRAA